MRYLKHKKTGRTFLYTETLAKHPDLEEVGAKNSALPEPEPVDLGKPVQQEEEPRTQIQTEDGMVDVGDATKDALDAYAQRHFGTKLDKRKTIEALADQVLALIDKYGHPDFD